MSDNFKKYVVVCYDITDNKRRVKIAKILEDYGVRAQYSVFECVIDEKHYNEMKERILAVMEEETDKVYFYNLCLKCQQDIETYGIREISEDICEVYII